MILKRHLWVFCVILAFGWGIGPCSATEHIQFRSAGNSASAPMIGGELFKPDKEGPFPAVVILHGCSGVNAHHANWARQFVRWGYVALVIDSFSARGVSNICNKTRVVAELDRALDTFAAANYLKNIPYVDENRIGIIGFSHGGLAVMRTVQASSKSIAGEKTFPFSAAVAFYPYCRETMHQNVSVPTLILIGENDDWTPAKSCQKLKEWVARPELLDVVVYENTYHSFDRNKSSRFYLGHRLEHNPEAARDAKKRTKAFFDANLQ